MEKLMKYEFKGTFRFFLGLYVIAILIYVLIFSQVNNMDAAFILGFVSMVHIALFSVLLIFCVNAFYKEFYEDQGYLTFTLPLRGSEILGTKLIVSLVWFLIAYIMSSITGHFALVIFNNAYGNIISGQSSWIVMGSQIIIYSFGISFFILLNYFAVAISKITVKGKKAGNMFCFVFVICLLAVYGYIIIKLSKFFPHTITIGQKISENNKVLIQFFNFIDISDTSIRMNTAVGVFNIIVFGVLFLLVSNILEHRTNI